MLSLQWKRNKNENGKGNGNNVFGFDPVRYNMQTNMIVRVMNGYVCGGCKK
jgi:hypothetical protein